MRITREQASAISRIANNFGLAELYLAKEKGSNEISLRRMGAVSAGFRWYIQPDGTTSREKKRKEVK